MAIRFIVLRFIVIVFGVVVIFLFSMVVVIIVLMHPAIEMFSFSPHKGRADHGFDSKTAPIGQAPLHHHTNQAIDGVVAGTILQIVFQAGMALNGEHRGHLKFAGG